MGAPSSHSTETSALDLTLPRAGATIATPQSQCHNTPHDRAGCTEQQRGFEAIAQGREASLQPGGTYVPESIHHGVDDVLGLGPAGLFDHREADFAAGPGDGVLRDATHDLQQLDYQQRGRE